MRIIVCLDDHNGMLFGGRRLSRDRELCRQMLSLAEGKLWMNAYSAKLFDDCDGITVCDDFLSQAGEQEYCLVEDQDIAPFAQKIEQIVIYRWNRAYPSDRKFPIALFENRWECVSSLDFPGSSHDKITQEVYCL